MRTKLTELSVRSLPPGKYFDRTTPAFGIRVGKNRRTWIVMRGQDRQLIRIGHYPSLSLVSFGEAYETFKKTASRQPVCMRKRSRPSIPRLKIELAQVDALQ